MTEVRQAIYVQLLGSAKIRLSHKQVRFVPDKRYQLLAYLAYKSDWVSRDKAAFLFWPDTDPQNAKANLRGLLKRVRALAWAPDLEVDAHQLRWRVATDVAAFQSETKAGSLDDPTSFYTGALLEGMDSDEAPEFSDWLEREREHLHTKWRTALLRRVQELEKLAQHKEAAGLLNRLLDQDALDEEALQAYMTAAALAGQEQEALRTYGSFSKRLKEELNLEPTSKTQQLAEVIQTAASGLEKFALDVTLPASSSVLATAVEPSTLPSTSLPKPRTSFVGRDLELAEVVHLLSKADCRLVTLTGAGGIGKTRLALQAAQDLVGRYVHGSHFIPLESLNSVGNIPLTIARILNISLQGDLDPLAQLAQHLRDKYILLVLDNYEHLTEGAILISELLQACPTLSFLITSRERLNLEEEWLLPVDGLAYPIAGVSLDQAHAYDAVQLFVQRAQRVLPSFRLTEEELPHILAICRLADGSPLGIELASVWTRAMPVGEIARAIAQNMDFLATSTRNVTKRHMSMRAVFEHSWTLLSSAEQEVLGKLAAFRGGFTKEAAALVANASIAVLAALLDKSLLRVNFHGRYDRHPLLHQYTEEKLTEQPEWERTRAKHAEYYLALAEEIEPHLRSAQQAIWLDPLEIEHNNLRVALRWFREQREIEKLLRLGGALWRFWDIRGYLSEGRNWLQPPLELLDAASPSAISAKALNGAGELAVSQGDYASAHHLFARGLAIEQALDNKQGVASFLNNLGNLAYRKGDYAAARSLYEEGLSVRREVDDQWGIASSLNNLGNVAYEEGDYAAARSFHEGSLAIRRRLQDEDGVSYSLSNLGVIACEQGKLTSARSLHEESLAIRRALGNKWGIASSLNNLGLVAFDQGDYAAARLLHEEGLTIERELENKSGVAIALGNLGNVAAMQGNYASARLFHEESLALRRELGSKRGVVICLINLGGMAFEQGDYATARALFSEGLKISRETHSRWFVPFCLEGIASVATAEGSPNLAVHLWGAAEVQREMISAPLPPSSRLSYERDVGMARDQLDKDAFVTAWERGRAMPIEHAIDYALEGVDT